MSILASAHWGLFPGYTVIGITLGGIYALAAIGLVLIYRVSGVLNFAQGAVSMFSAFIAYQVSTVMGYPAAVGLLAAIVAGGAIGYLIERFTIRPLAGRSALSKVVVTIGWLLVLQTATGAIAGVLITPRINFDPISLTIVVIDAFTAALIGRLTSLPWTVVGAMFLGLAETYPRIFSSNAGAGDAVTFTLVLLTLAILFRPGARLVQRISAAKEYAPVPATDNPRVRRVIAGAGIG